MGDKITKSEAEWRKFLNAEEFRVARQRGTERAFTGKYWDNHEEGRYLCVCCGSDLYASKDKFNSGTGWPSFTASAGKDSVSTKSDTSFFMTRTEAACSRCDAHLGHVFDDGPQPTGQRHCINSASLRFVKKGEEEKKS